MRFAFLALLMIGVALSGVASSKPDKNGQKGQGNSQQQEANGSQTVLFIGEESAEPKAADDEAKNRSEFDRQVADYTHKLADYTFWLAVLTGLLCLVGCIQIGFLFRGDSTTRKAAKAAQDSADIARSTLVATHRPWVTLAMFMNGDLVFENGRAKLSITYRIKNIGESPAIAIRMGVFNSDAYEDGMDLHQIVLAELKQVRETNPRSGLDLFPDEELEGAYEANARYAREMKDEFVFWISYIFTFQSSAAPAFTSIHFTPERRGDDGQYRRISHGEIGNGLTVPFDRLHLKQRRRWISQR